MTTHANDDVNARLDRLERDLRRWRRAAVVAGGVLGLVGLVGATTPKAAPVADEIRARQFVLVDEAGRERGRLAVKRAVTGESEPTLSLYGEDGRTVVGLSPIGLVINNNNLDKWSAVALSPFGVNVDEGGSIVHAPRREPVLDWVGPSLVLYGGAPRLTLVDERRRTRAVLGYAALETFKTGAVEQRPPSSLVLLDKDNKVLFLAP